MKILVIGSGGREHAIIWALKKSKRVDKVYCCPGNAGIAAMADCVDIEVENVNGLIDFVKYEWIDCTIVGPEVPLCAGIVDSFEKEGLKIFGPNRMAAELECSKAFSKDFMRRYGIPTADYKVFSSNIFAEEYVRIKGAPIVVKADGLAAGKGVIVAGSTDDAIAAIRLIMKDRAFGNAGDKVIIEDCIEGEEASFMAFTDGKTIIPMVSSQDHKRIFDNDLGPNTGGMGAYSPATVITPEIEQIVMEKVMKPVIHNLAKEGIKYKGILYAGLMIKDGKPYVLEFNCRLGDPETQAVLMRLESELIDIIFGVIEGNLDKVKVEWSTRHSVTVVLASGGYPGKFEKDKPISGLDKVKALKDVVVFHAGTGYKDNSIVTSGGRVCAVSALGRNIKDALEKAYSAIKLIHFDNMHYRKDIAHRAVTLKPE
ncbi:MAG: phosphoribosylamine--glycine ligase [Nitrospirae bacterium]|nr:phosphoribosylamine--glycine ligase [Nitrospirota bacterium]MBF0535125.1 phosphoribosylamine--glycine ligase [Nitrospirota bacterium]MBF0615325.1 phosphoribosylamine--glycine ligase [Nitrospirota bacterium]